MFPFPPAWRARATRFVYAAAVSAAAPAVAPLVGEDGVPTGVVFEGSGESVSFGDLGVLLTGRGRDKREQ